MIKHGPLKSIPMDLKNRRDGYISSNHPDYTSEDFYNNFASKQWEKRRKARLDKTTAVFYFLKQWLPLTTILLILVIWQAWAETQ